MRRMAVAVLVVLTALTGATAVAVAADQAVTVEGGPATPAVFVERCNDVGYAFDEQLSFVLRRPAPATDALTVDYQLSGTAQAGVHYVALPGSVTFPPGAESVTVDVVPLPTPRGTLVDLTMTVDGDSATIHFVSPPPPGPYECGYFFTGDPWNTSQTVAVGEPLHPLTLQQLAVPFLVPATGRFRVVSGMLPPGVTLNPDGTFAGVPLVPGTYAARIEACRPEPPGTCVTTDLTVTVQGTFADAVNALVVALGQQVGALLRQIFAGLLPG